MATGFSVFRVVFALTVGWYLALLLAAGLIFGLLGDAGTFWVHTTLMGALAILSGPLLAYHIRNNPHEHNERGEWTSSELFFAIVFFITLFIFLNSVAFMYISG